MASRNTRAIPFLNLALNLALPLAIALSALSASACVKVQPYERGMLAHPTMVADDMSNAMDGHVREVSEGAAGGLGGGGGGCGCN